MKVRPSVKPICEKCKVIKSVLSLSKKIIHHAKIQNFDEVSRFDRNQEAMTFVDEALHANTDRGLDAFIRSSDLKKAWGNYPYAMMHPENLSYDTRDLLWRSISLFF